MRKLRSLPPARRVLFRDTMPWLRRLGAVLLTLAACAPPTANELVESPTVSRPARPLALRGIDLAGAEFGDVYPGQEGVDYAWPSNGDIDYFAAKGMTVVRIGFAWERLQPAANGELDAAYFAKLDALVRHAGTKGVTAILDPHNFAKYHGAIIGTDAVPVAVFADLWRRLATVYAGAPHVIFDLMNEPHDMPTEQWVAAANAALVAIRETGATNVVQVPGNGWTGAYSWKSSDYGTPNAVAMLDIVDPGDNMVFEAHQYLDADAGGEASSCVSRTIGSERLQPFLEWLRANGKRGFIGELAGGHDRTCNEAIEDMLTTIEGASDVLDGWVWWAAGPSWGSYPFSLQPVGGKDMPLMKVLAPHLGR